MSLSFLEGEGINWLLRMTTESLVIINLNILKKKVTLRNSDFAILTGKNLTRDLFFRILRLIQHSRVQNCPGYL